jgi:hypothetical protein
VLADAEWPSRSIMVAGSKGRDVCVMCVNRRWRVGVKFEFQCEKEIGSTCTEELVLNSATHLCINSTSWRTSQRSPIDTGF